MKKIVSLALTLALLLAMTACGGSPAPSPALAPEPETSGPESPASQEDAEPEAEVTTILIAAAASLEYSLRDELIPLFQEKHPEIVVEGTYDSSGKLQTQIQEGLDADLFFSAAQKQMNALKEQGLVDAGSVTDLLENKLVVIAPADSPFKSLMDFPKAERIALGDPESVPVGQYAKEALTNLGLWEVIQAKVSFGTNVTEVLNWVAEGSADLGVVYATDAATTDKVVVLAEAPKEALATPVIYPVGIVASSQKKEAARLFLEFLRSDEAMAVFETYGFAAA